MFLNRLQQSLELVKDILKHGVIFQMKRIADFKEKHKQYLHNLMPNDEKDAFMNHNVVNVLTERDQLGRRILLVNCGGSSFPKLFRD